MGMSVIHLRHSDMKVSKRGFHVGFRIWIIWVG